MAMSFTGRKRIRKNFGQIPEVAPMPNLIEVQMASYEQFLRPSAERRSGLEAVFTTVFPITDYAGRVTLDFAGYELEEPKFDVEECQQRGLTYGAPLKVTLRLNLWNIDEDTGARSFRVGKQQDVYMGDMPLMTANGTFIVNGTERVIVSQMHRSPGVFFGRDRGSSQAAGKLLFFARVIPYRGSWLDFEFDAKDLVQVRIDRRRKLPVTTLLRALDSAATETARRAADGPVADAEGMTEEEILGYFYDRVTYRRVPPPARRAARGRSRADAKGAPAAGRGRGRAGAKDAPATGGTADGSAAGDAAGDAGAGPQSRGWTTPFDRTRMAGVRLARALADARTGEEVAAAGTRMTPRQLDKLEAAGLKELLVADADLVGRYCAVDYARGDGLLLLEAGDEITGAHLDLLAEHGIDEIACLDLEYAGTGPYIRNTLAADKVRCREGALSDIYKIMRPGEPPTLETAEHMFSGLFFDADRYDLSDVGRVKMNARLPALDCPDSERVLRKADILEIIRELVRLRDGESKVDDIDHLGNRRVRSVGELMENQYRVGLVRMERGIRERLSAVDIDTVVPQDLINAKPAASAVREFFGSSQLSQFMDQTNPLSEITHKRRLSALGPGGLTRERASFEVRDVHPTHYGRICPVETPEGPNIGLINSLATYARINKYGFIESPYRRVVRGRVTDEVVYLSAMEEDGSAGDRGDAPRGARARAGAAAVRRPPTIAQANAQLNARGRFAEDLVSCRRGQDYVMESPQKIEYMDVSPKQLVSVAAALIPFLENDDANRALMGSNMQRQAVPLIRAEAPLVGTGMEAVVARDSGVAIVARRSGTVDQVDATRIVVRSSEDTAAGDSGVDIYNLTKFRRSNQSTCITQRPLVKVGDEVSRGDIVADGPSTDLGELALGRNVLVAFMPWQGYNFEDSILISERVVRDDVFTSIHIEEFEVSARDTKLGQEEITYDIPNLGEDVRRILDESGIVHIGAEVQPGDILVGKVTPKSESPLTPEEKLLRAIFGEKAADVRDTSLRVPPGVSGTVVEVRVFTRSGLERDDRAQRIVRAEIDRLMKDRDDEKAILERSFFSRLKELLINQIAVGGPKGLKPGTRVTARVLGDFTPGQWRRINVKNDRRMALIEALRRQFDASVRALEARFQNKSEKVERGDELLPGVMRMVKVFVAVKRKLQPGDKIAGRHGNKGVISKIMPIEDMPYLDDGTPVDIVLNPLGVPSRMNVGQILETHLGWASARLGRRIGRLLDGSGAGGAAELKKTLQEVYGRAVYREAVAGLDREQLVELAGNLRNGVPVASPVFDGARESEIFGHLDMAGLDRSGQVRLIDGRTGEPFDRPVTVGYIYMLKLHHLVDDKIHARSIGPYSLVTQQPLGGKAQFGGQRFGEMEVWALEAYGAAYTLQEMLTVKSDDVSGRTKVYESIIRGDDNFEAGIPESFNVLVKELRSLGLNVDLKQASY